MEWCSICGAIRKTEYANMKNGGLQTTTQWMTPFVVDAQWAGMLDQDFRVTSPSEYARLQTSSE